MKLKLYILTALCFILVNELCAQDYQIRDDRTVITVSKDCSIPVDSFAPSGINIYGDRNIGGVGHRNSILVDLFSERTAQLNNNPNGISFKRDNIGVANVVIDYESINDETEIKFYQAMQNPKDMNDWIPDTVNTFQVTIKKIQTNDNTATSPGNNSMSFPGNQTAYNTSNMNKEVAERAGENHPEKIVLIVLLIGLFICYFLYRQNRKVLKELSKECSDLRKVVDNLEKRNNAQAVSHQTTQQKSKGKSSMTDDEIKRFIVEQIKSLQTQFSLSTLQPTIATNSNLDSVANSLKKEEQTTDTDNVKYHQDDNSFSLEQTDIKIFRIYSKQGEYYYTIVDDSAVREELIGMLQMFEGCITYQTTDGVAKRVEPVTEGKLRKDGNKFYVDANNKLVVRFA